MNESAVDKTNETTYNSRARKEVQRLFFMETLPARADFISGSCTILKMDPDVLCNGLAAIRETVRMQREEGTEARRREAGACFGEAKARQFTVG